MNKLRLAKAYLYLKRGRPGGRGQEPVFVVIKRLLDSPLSAKALSLACYKWRSANPEAWQREQAEAEKDPVGYFEEMVGADTVPPLPTPA